MMTYAVYYMSLKLGGGIPGGRDNEEKRGNEERVMMGVVLVNVNSCGLSLWLRRGRRLEPEGLKLNSIGGERDL